MKKPDFFTNTMTKAEMVSFLTEVRQECLCAYGTSTRCDCKYGADRIGQHSETGCGCPEMRNIIFFLESITNRQFAEIAKKVWPVDDNDVADEDSKITELENRLSELEKIVNVRYKKGK
jgi:hypothetical protein